MTLPDTAAWLVWSFDEDGWWGQGGWGATRRIAEAARYSEADARTMERRANADGYLHALALPLLHWYRLIRGLAVHEAVDPARRRRRLRQWEKGPA